MDSGETPDKHPSNSREQRDKALRQLAQVALPDRPTSAADRQRSSVEATAHRTRLPRNRWFLFAIVTILLAIVVSSSAFFFINQSHSRQPTRISGPITPRLNALNCPHDIAWAPDNTRIAIVGYRNACGQDDLGAYASVPGWLTIYDVTSSRLLASFSPDQAIDFAPNVVAPTNATPQASGSDVTHPMINYQHLLWSPDGKSLALTFEINEGSSTLRPTRLYGVEILISETGAPSKVLTHVASASDPAYLEWDVTRGKLLTTALATPTALSNLPIGQRLSWGADGAITAMSGASDTFTPVGQPDGGASFSIWQPGNADLLKLGGTGKPIICIWQSDFAAWSPSGQYLLATAQAGGIMSKNGCVTPTAAELRISGYTGSPGLIPRDRALATIYKALGTTPGVTNGQSIAWRPDGAELAVISNDEATSPAPSSRVVAVFDTLTGNKIARLTPRANTQYAFDKQSDPMLRWSPDGSRLLLLDSQLGVVTIWDKSNGLPA